MIIGTECWNYRHYVPLADCGARGIVVSRLVPVSDGFELAWDDEGVADGYVVWWREVQSGRGSSLRVVGRSAVVSGLREGRDYRVWVESCPDGRVSGRRLMRCGSAFGTVVNYLHPGDGVYRCSGRFLASPSLVELASGRLLVSMDVFEWHGGQNLTLLFASDDRGRTWRHVTDLFPCFWGSLFVHRGALYMLAMATEYGDVLIGRSDDGGETWTAPVALFRGSGNGDVGGPHKAPMPVVESHGSLVTAIDYGSWETGGLRQALLSVDADADLLDARRWRLGVLCDPRAELLRGCGIVGGGLEGNVVPGPDGGVYDLLRLQIDRGEPRYGRALLLRADAGLERLVYAGTVEYNGGSNSKFFVRFDGRSGLYWALGNEIVDPGLPGARNVLSLSVSKDLSRFVVVHRVVDMSRADPAFVAAQYPSFVFSGEDMLVVSRSAANGADSYHNSNYITFHTVRNFRQYATSRYHEMGKVLSSLS